MAPKNRKDARQVAAAAAVAVAVAVVEVVDMHIEESSQSLDPEEKEEGEEAVVVVEVGKGWKYGRWCSAREASHRVRRVERAKRHILCCSEMQMNMSGPSHAVRRMVEAEAAVVAAVRIAERLGRERKMVSVVEIEEVNADTLGL